IRERRFEQLLDRQRRFLARKCQDTQRLAYTLPAHCVHHRPYLARRDANVCCTCFHHHAPSRPLPTFASAPTSAPSYALSYHYEHGMSGSAKILPVCALPCFP